jgi:hypothetical protein
VDSEFATKYNEELNEILNGRHEFITQNYPSVRDAYQKAYEWPEMDTLRHEIALALIFGLHQAAITLTNHLLESLMKTSLIMFESSQDKSGDTEDHRGLLASLKAKFKSAISKYGNSDLGPNINRARKLGIIDKDEAKVLDEFRVNFRNAYGHSDKRRTFGDASTSMQAAKIEDDRIVTEPPEITRLHEIVIGQGLFQAYQARAQAVPYFLYMDGLTRKMRGRLFSEDKPDEAP